MNFLQILVVKFKESGWSRDLVVDEKIMLNMGLTELACYYVD